MREIEFRGKRSNNGEWIYGDLIHAGPYVYIYPVGHLEPDGHHLSAVDDGPHWVEPETVGQYTGLTDVKGTKIFEGDIVSYWDGNIYECNDGDILINGKRYRRCINKHCEVVFADGAFRIKNGNTLDSFYGESALEVIGNIHE